LVVLQIGENETGKAKNLSAPLLSLGTDPTENTISIVLAQQ
jgi:hypothetical protein